MNLRLGPDAEEAVRLGAKRAGCSQQDVIREAVSCQLGLASGGKSQGDFDMLVSTGAVRAPITPYRRVIKRLTLPLGATSAGLLERDDRI